MFVLLKSHIWCLYSPLFPLSSNWDLWASSLCCPTGSIQVPPPALGQISLLFPSAERRCRWPYREGLYGKTVGRGLEILGNHMVLLILQLSEDLSSQIRVFNFQGEEGKRKKEGKKLTLWCDDRDFYKSHCVSHCCWQPAKPELAKFPQVEYVTGSLKIHPQVFNYLFCHTRLLKLRDSVRQRGVDVILVFSTSSFPISSVKVPASPQDLGLFSLVNKTSTAKK